MEWIWAALNSLAAVGAIVLAIISERRARRAAKESKDSAAAATRAADALEEANRLAVAANPPDAPPWSEARWVSGEVFAIRNESKRAAIVTGIEPDNERFAGMLHHRVKYPFRVDPGDNIPVMCVGTMAGRVSPILVWHWDESPESEQKTRRGVSKSK